MKCNDVYVRDNIRRKAPKFVCLNDDMNKTHAAPRKVLRALHGFARSLLPLPSPFELVRFAIHPYLVVIQNF